MKMRLFLMLTVVAFGMIACNDSDFNGGRLNVDFNTVTNPNGTSQRTVANGLEFNDGFITLSELRFEAEGGDDSLEIEFELEQQTIVDFATGSTSPDISGVSIPAGTYEEVEIEIELFDENDDPGVVLTGTFTYDGETHPVRFEFNSGETFELEIEGTIVFSDNTEAFAQITLDPHVWFANVTALELAEAERDAEGVIVISESVNSDIFEKAADGLDIATEVEIEM